MRRSLLLLTFWNGAFILLALALIALGGEVYFRLTWPGWNSKAHTNYFVPGVGLTYAPHSELRHTNHLDYWTIAQVNKWGFPDRDPLSPEQAAAGCHIAIVGDSMVAAREVPLEDKFQVRLEERAGRELTDLAVTTSAFARHTTAQANQLAFYDAFARQLRPKAVVLVFHPNDLLGNSAVITALRWGIDPDRPPWAFPERRADGTIGLRPPHPEYRQLPRRPLARLTGRFLVEKSYFWSWLDAKVERVALPVYSRERERERERDDSVVARVDLLSRRPAYQAIRAGWQPSTVGDMEREVYRAEPAPLFQEALDFTAFALSEFQRRADRDGAQLVILATYRMGASGHPPFDLLKSMADERGIPVISQHDYILSQAGRIEDAHFKHDNHWSSAGHQWAADAFLEYLKDNREICDD